MFINASELTIAIYLPKAVIHFCKGLVHRRGRNAEFVICVKQ